MENEEQFGFELESHVHNARETQNQNLIAIEIIDIEIEKKLGFGVWTQIARSPDITSVGYYLTGARIEFDKRGKSMQCFSRKFELKPLESNSELNITQNNKIWQKKTEEIIRESNSDG